MVFEAWWLSRLEPLLQVKDAWLLMWLMGAVGATQVATGSLAVCVDADEAGAWVMVFEVCRLSRLEPLLQVRDAWLLMCLMGAVGAPQVATGSLAICVDADEAGAWVMVFEVCRLSRLEPLLRGMTHW